MAQKLKDSPKRRAPCLFRALRSVIPRSRAARLCLSFFLLFVIGFFAIIAGATCWISLVSQDFLYRDMESLPAHDVGLLLGTSKFTRAGYSNLHFHSRIKAAAELYESGKIKHILASGSNPNRHYNEPADMRDALMKQGVPAAAITLDTFGFRTLDSIVRAKEVFGLQRFTIISQEYHNGRAVFIAKHFQCDVVAYCASPVEYPYSIRTEIREYFARVKAILDLYVLGKQPKHLGEAKTIILPPPAPHYSDQK